MLEKRLAFGGKDNVPGIPGFRKPDGDRPGRCIKVGNAHPDQFAVAAPGHQCAANQITEPGVYAVLGAYLIAAARKPSENRSLISFTIWANVVHAGIMAAQSIYDERERGHLIGDVPALLLVAAVLWFLSPAKQKGPDTA